MLPAVRSSSLRLRILSSSRSMILRHESTSGVAPKAAVPEKAKSSILGPLIAATALFAGTYFGGLVASEYVPEVKKVYDEYLPYTKEVKQFIGLLPPDKDSKPLISVFDKNFKDLFSTKKAPSTSPKKETPPSDNAPFIPKEGVKVVVTEPPPTPAPAPSAQPTPPPAAAAPEQPNFSAEVKTERKGEDREDIPVQGPPMGVAPARNQETAPLIGLEEDNNGPVKNLVKQVVDLNKEIEEKNQAAVGEALERSRSNLQLADETIKDLKHELAKLLEKTDTVLTSARSAEIQSDIDNLRLKLEQLSQEKTQAEEKFKIELDALHDRLQREAHAKFDALHQQHLQEIQDEANRHDKDLAQQYRNQENMYNLRVKEELQKQEEALETLFKEELDLTIRKERAERMAKVERLTATAKVLEQISRKQGLTEADNVAVRKILLAMTGFQDAIENKRPFTKELAFLKSVSSSFPMIQQVIEIIEGPVAERGVATPADLSTRFVLVKKAVSEAAYVTPNGGMWSFTVSWLLSHLSFSQTGLVEGDDVSAILARSEHHLLRGDIESATREMNQLKGWQKKLAQDWLNASREYLEVHQALAVVEAEIAHQLLVL